MRKLKGNTLPMYVAAILNVVKKNSKNPLTFTALTDDCTLEFQVNSESIIPTLEYSIDGGDWQEWAESVSIPQGSRLQCRGINQDGINPGYEASDYNYFVGTGKYDVSGNIMTLIDYTNPPTTMVGTFLQLFGREEGDIIDVVNAKNLLLPATTLTSDCYQRMFDNCVSLISAPELPATVLADYCYLGMFYGCTSLTSAPELPAMELTDSCYFNMFCECTGLTSAPELPATELAKYCYYSMFSGCTGLTSAPELPAMELTDSCYEEMFYGCTSLISIDVSFNDWGDSSTYNWLGSVGAAGTFICPAGLEQIFDSSHIPGDWTVVTK